MIFYAKIISKIDEHRYKVQRVSNSINTLEATLYREATVLSPMPTIRGAGFKAAMPAVIDNQYCIIAEDGLNWYIIGFVPVASSMSVSTTRNTPNNEAGGFVLGTADGTRVQAYEDGSLSIFTSAYSQLVLDPRSESIFAQFKAGVFKWWTGSFSVKPGAIKVYFAKDQDKTALPIYKTQLPPDNFVLDVGKLNGSTATIAWTLSERYTAIDNPDYTIKGSIGVNNGNALELSTASTSLNAEGKFAWLEDGSLNYSSKSTGASKEIKVILGTSDPAVTFDIGPGKCTITIDSQGNVKFKTTDGANIFLGGQGKEQQLVTKSWVDQVYKTHIHPTTSPGSPTLVPTPDLTRPSSSDNPAGHFTFTTKAE
jgi:hypothetical protein